METVRKVNINNLAKLICAMCLISILIGLFLGKIIVSVSALTHNPTFTAVDMYGNNIENAKKCRIINQEYYCEIDKKDTKVISFR